MSQGLGGLGEFGLIRALTKSLRRGDGVRQGIGDDCAVVEVGGVSLLITCDASLEGIHFQRNWGAPGDIGWKAGAAALSDIAAMGGRAKWALVTLALPNDLSEDYARALYGGIVEAVESAGAAIIGGDTTASQSGIVLDLVIVGEVVGRPGLRTGGKPSDLVAVSGVPGRRGAGLYALLHGLKAPALIREYLRPVPRLAAGQWLQAQSAVRAMMDVSDGLIPDTRHLAEAGGVGIDLRPRLLTPDAALDAFWSEQGRDPATERLRSGEEYELLVILKAGAASETCRAFQDRFNLPLTVVGACAGPPAAVTVDGEAPAESGFEHFTSN